MSRHFWLPKWYFCWSFALGELDAWIVDELAHLRQFSKALSILAAEAEG